MFLTNTRSKNSKINANSNPAVNRSHRAFINGIRIEVGNQENLLSAALRQGIDFPHSCRVGGCASCKCQLTSGRVKELTETGYILSDEELDKGYILACQSIPQTDVNITVSHKEKVFGKVISQKILNTDICELQVQLNKSLEFKAGQYASLSIEGIDAERNYSFSNAPNKKNQITFLIRKVPGGRLSNFIFDHKLIGKKVTVKGPFGNFWLRDSDDPILMVAGGSGLAPILSMLEQGILEGCKRPVTLLFGAKQKKDLYKIKEIQQIQKNWKGDFKFIPVLSEEPAKSKWKGERGLVTSVIQKNLTSKTEAYLCGPPIMVDLATKELKDLGISKFKIFADRFTTIDHSLSLNLNESVRNEKAGFFQYLKFFLFHAVGLFSAASLALGGEYTSYGLITLLLFYLVGDAISGNDTSTPEFQKPMILTVQLWMALPLLCLILFISVWSVSPTDTFGFGAWLTSITGFDFLNAKNLTTPFQHFCGFILSGLMIGLVGTITAHELTHRTWDKISMFFGRWLLAFSFDTIFSIEHVYGHHRYVSTIEDPATAPRGRNVYFHILSSTIKGNVSAWKIETKRLNRKKLNVFSIHNAFLRGHFMSFLLVGLAYFIGGISGMIFFIASALFGKALLEIVNYMEHYGMVRLPEEPVQPRHSWNTNRRISSWTMFNLTRHSHHHAQGEVPYQNLRPFPSAPMMINGYLTTLVVALIPPLWHHLMTPKVMEWDKKYASPDELELSKIANQKSGIRRLMEANYK